MYVCFSKVQLLLFLDAHQALYYHIIDLRPHQISVDALFLEMSAQAWQSPFVPRILLLSVLKYLTTSNLHRSAQNLRYFCWCCSLLDGYTLPPRDSNLRCRIFQWQTSPDLLYRCKYAMARKMWPQHTDEGQTYAQKSTKDCQGT